MADQFVVERSETIAATPEEVFGKVGTLQGWDEWSPWAEMDPDMNKTYSGEPGTVGSIYSWSGNRKVGEGQMTITGIDPNARVAIDLKFLKPFKSENTTELLLATNGSGTDVTWRMTGPMTLMTKVMGFIGKTMDKMVGPDFEKGLSKLKRISEA
ncbi:MAG: SRPBCC family protein [Acidimicrobiales bacterium]